jgi:hypothetical protein
MLREKSTVKADDVTESERRLRSDFARHILITLYDLRKAGTAENVGHRARAAWRLNSQASADK